MSVRNCPKCHIFEAKPQTSPLEPILCTEPLDLVHIDYMSMEVTVGIKEKPVVKNVLVIKDYFTAPRRMSPTIILHTLWRMSFTTSFSRCLGSLDD